MPRSRSAGQSGVDSETVLDRIFHDSDSEFLDSDSDDVEFELNDVESEIESEYDVSDSETESESVNVPQPATNTTTNGWTGVTSNHTIPVWCPEYTRSRGRQFPADFDSAKGPLEYFLLLFPDQAFELMAVETNRFALESLDTPAELPAYSRHRRWSDTTPDELKAFLGLQILIGLNPKPRIEEYWRVGEPDSMPGFAEVMSRNRFQLLSTFLHFNDNSTRVPRGAVGFDHLHKVRPLLDLLRPLSKAYYVPGRELAVDETMRRFTGRIYFKQYVRNKPVPWGIKLWSLCESQTGYLLDWEVYTGKEVNAVDRSNGLSHEVVMKLMSDFNGCGHHLFMYNFYTSPDLLDALQRLNTGACGTVRVNRKKSTPRHQVSEAEAWR